MSFYHAADLPEIHIMSSNELHDATLPLADDMFVFQANKGSDIYTPPIEADEAFDDLLFYRHEPMHICPFNITTCTGCLGASTDGSDVESGRSPLSSAQLSPEDEDRLSARREASPTSSIVSLNSPAANRVQLKEEMLQHFFPAGLFETDFMYTKLISREALEAEGPAMEAAVDALALVYIGSAHHDAGMVQRARQRYETAVSCLNRELAKPNAMTDDSLFGAIYALGFCEMFQPLASRISVPQTHVNGLRDLLLARGPASTYSKFGQLLVYNVRHLTAMIACAERKKSDFGDRAWKRCSAVTDGHMTALSDQIIRFPATLERVDGAMKRSRLDPGEMFSVLTELANLERHTQSWLLSWYRTFDRLPYRTEKVERFPHFHKHGGSVANTFPQALRFPTFSQASAHISYWILLLQQKHAMFDVNRRYRVPILPKAEAILIAEATECADRLCESIAYLTQSCYGYCGVIRARAPLYYASLWYTTTGQNNKARWCTVVEESISEGRGDLFFSHHVTPVLGEGVDFEEIQEEDEPFGEED